MRNINITILLYITAHFSGVVTNTVNALISPWWAYLFLVLPDGRFIREGNLLEREGLIRGGLIREGLVRKGLIREGGLLERGRNTPCISSRV